MGSTSGPAGRTLALWTPGLSSTKKTTGLVGRALTGKSSEQRFVPNP